MNYALSCFFCNSSKSDHVTGIDPETNREELLFNPRQQIWSEHFRWAKRFRIIEGTTPIGRATVHRLKLNGPDRLKARPLWRATGVWP